MRLIDLLQLRIGVFLNEASSMRTALSVALILLGVTLIFAWGPLGYVVGGCFAIAGVLMFSQEMQHRHAKLIAPTDQLLRAIPTEVAAMLPAALPSPRVQMLNRAFGWGMLGLSSMGLYSIFLSNFVPAPTTVAVAKGLTPAVGLSDAVFFVGFEQFGWDPQNPKVMAAVAQRPILGKVYIRAPFMAVVFRRFCVDVVLKRFATCVDRDCGQARADGCRRKGAGAGFVQCSLREFLRQADA